MTLTFEDALRASGGESFDAPSPPLSLRVVTDTRALEPGDTFLALRGDRFDGHAFVREAGAKGAAAFVIADPSVRIDGVPTIVVADTLQAYMAIASAARSRFNGRVLAITGSAGKTTTKSFAVQLLAQRHGERVFAAPANENNEIGVSKLLLRANDAQHDVLVVEMGARHYGDIAKLVDIARPDVAVLTNVGDAHLEIMGSRERLEETKWAIFRDGAKPIVNASDAASRARAQSLAVPPHWFSAGPADEIRGLARVTRLDRSAAIDIDGDSKAERPVAVRVPGTHNVANAAAAAAAALELDVAFDAIVRALPNLEMPAGRYQRLALSNGTTIVYDAYNANAAGMAAALEAFADEKASRHIAVLASMAELGPEAGLLHREVGAHAARTRVDALLVGGEFAEEIASGARAAGFSSQNIVHFASNVEAAHWLREHARDGDVVLLKGSRKYQLEEIVQELRG